MQKLKTLISQKKSRTVVQKTGREGGWGTEADWVDEYQNTIRKEEDILVFSSTVTTVYNNLLYIVQKWRKEEFQISKYEEMINV